MKTVLRMLCLLSIVFATACATRPADQITQISTIDAVLAGGYDGQLTLQQLKSHGDFGIGTFHALDGEMAMYGGHLYQFTADGRLSQPPDSVLTPFASVVTFAPDLRGKVAGFPVAMPALLQQIDQAIGNSNIACAVCVHGTFVRMKTRSVPAQHKPYPPLVEVTKTQPVFEYSHVTGVLVGFRVPGFMKGLNVPGYHLHFLSDDRTQGGHVLDFDMTEGEFEVDRCSRFLMIVPETAAAGFGSLDLSVDRSGDLMKAEK